MNYRHQDPTYTQNIKEKVTVTKNTPEFKKEQSVRSSKQIAELKINNPIRFQMQLDNMNRGFKDWISIDDNRKHLSDKTTEFFEDPVNRKNLSNKRMEYYAVPGNIEKQRVINKEIQNRPEVREKQRSHWRDDEYADKRLKQRYKFKKYEMPSGRIVHVQGYENFAIDLLLQQYEENDIVVACDGISKFTGVIEYELNGTHTYKPDIYIKSKNMIIEVKSAYTYNAAKKQTHAKAQACVNLGFTFYLMIL
ncbi:MAG: hypothetical protein M0R51_01450 [Clostridia bacterium]|jgi:hypothetical protein|nr:hypothetical protein [Clostridia bacterium]